MITQAITVYLHRSQTHQSVELHPIISHFARLLLWLKCATATKPWVAVHRLHHAEVETDIDPHSPVKKGLLSVLFLGYFHYKNGIKELKEMTVGGESGYDHYGIGTPNDWMERNVYSKFTFYGLILNLFLWFVLFGPPGIILWLIDTLWMPLAAGGVINGIGHSVGYRTYDTKDNSRNVLPFDPLFGGEIYHNNHHKLQWSPKFSHKWWEIDTGWISIQILRFFRLAKLKRAPGKF